MKMESHAIISHVDILKELSKTDLLNLSDILALNLPQHIRPYNYIKNYLLHFDKINANRSEIYSGRWNVKFFGHRRGRPNNCTFVTVTAKQDYCITVFTLEDGASELSECLLTTKLIDWNHRPFSLAVDEQHCDIVKCLLNENEGSDWKYEQPEYIMYIAKEKIEKLPLPIIPDDVFIRKLSTKHAKFINDNWMYKYAESDKLIAQSIELNGGLGLFKRGVENPIAWIGTNDFFTPGFLHTIDTERRKGYGTIVFIHELKRLVEAYNLDLFTYVVSCNSASAEMHRRLGFTVVNSITWIVK